MDVFLGIVVGIAIVGIMLALVYWQGSKSKQLIEEWAREKQFQLIRVEERSFWKGPFFWTTNARKQVVFFVVVLDGEGQERRGWIRCGGKVMGGVFGSSGGAVGEEVRGGTWEIRLDVAMRGWVSGIGDC